MPLPDQAGGSAWGDGGTAGAAGRAREETVELFTALLAHASESLVLVDEDGRIQVGVGPEGGVLGHGERVGRHLIELAHPDDLPRALEAMAEVLSGHRPESVHVGRARHADGRWHTVELYVADRRQDPLLRGIVVRTRDLSAGKEEGGDGDRDFSLAESLAEVVPDPIILADRNSYVLFANPAAERLLGRTTDELRGVGALEWIEPADRGRFEQAVGAVQQGEREQAVSFRPAGDPEVLLEGRLVGHGARAGVTGGWLAVVADVTARRRTERQLYHQATHDPLTGLLNRSAFEDRLAQALVRAARESFPVSVLYIDLTGFKAVNDTFGHRTGDLVLAELGRRLAATVREGEAVARLGGDEFAVVCEQAPPAAAEVLADRVRDALSGPIPVGGPDTPTLMVTGDVGIATCPPGPAEVGALIDLADRMMYQVKRGRAPAYHPRP